MTVKGVFLMVYTIHIVYIFNSINSNTFAHFKNTLFNLNCPLYSIGCCVFLYVLLDMIKTINEEQQRRQKQKKTHRKERKKRRKKICNLACHVPI